MVAYSFKVRFVAPMLRGVKDGTIRKERSGSSAHARPGQAVANYIGMRTARCELILRSVCVLSAPIVLRWRPVIEFTVDGERVPTAALDDVARRDGFDDLRDMEAFWAEVHPGIAVFSGRLIRWQPPAQWIEMGATVARPGDPPSSGVRGGSPGRPA